MGLANLAPTHAIVFFFLRRDDCDLPVRSCQHVNREVANEGLCDAGHLDAIRTSWWWNLCEWGLSTSSHGVGEGCFKDSFQDITLIFIVCFDN